MLAIDEALQGALALAIGAPRNREALGGGREIGGRALERRDGRVFAAGADGRAGAAGEADV
ncbi:MAG TPA: hypothetical protein VFS43_38025 [Polyangiaceae bacterium]|nr:hypothetical protein [Polyangiaceae bacterium]